MIGPADFIALLVIASLCSLDTVSVGQTMVSRPIVSATLGAAALGRAEDGLVVGAVMELFALETLPFGASRYPEWGAAGVVAATTYVIGGRGSPGSLAFAVLIGLAVAGLGSISMVWHRRRVAVLAGVLREELAIGSAAAVTRLHVTGIALDLWRGVLVASAGLILAFAFTMPVLSRWNIAFGQSLTWPLILATAVGAAALVRCARPMGAIGYLGGGLAVGIVAMVAR
ncbi:MAG: PTS sugar transporter subunit IIC [Gemmatimonadetes bacterium]|nr:PTS sugar transporter subunit IIC [Gemmatimonadota bacterium]